MKPYWFGAIALAVILLFVGLGYADKTRLHWVAEADALPAPVAQPTPDRVMGIETRCDTWVSDGTHREYWGAFCTEAYTNAAMSDVSIAAPGGGGNGGAFNRRQVLTIRGATYSYTVAVSLITKVAIGDEWPPK